MLGNFTSIANRIFHARWLIVAALVLLLPTTGKAADFQIEPGFTAIFNGKDLTGWKVRGGDSLEGKAEAPKKRFQVTDGKIVIDGKTKGNMVIDTTKEFAGDVQLRFQYLPGPTCNNDLYFRGVKFDLKKGSVKNIKFGEWNDLEITVKGNEMEIKNDGQTQHTAKTKSNSSPLGLRAEFGSVEYRRLRSQP